MVQMSGFSCVFLLNKLHLWPLGNGSRNVGFSRHVALEDLPKNTPPTLKSDAPVGAIPCGCPPKTNAPEQKGNRKGLPLQGANVLNLWRVLIR